MNEVGEAAWGLEDLRRLLALSLSQMTAMKGFLIRGMTGLGE